MPRPSCSSDARYVTIARGSTSAGGAPVALGTVAGAVAGATMGAASARSCGRGELQASGATTKLSQVVARRNTRFIGCDSMPVDSGEQTRDVPVGGGEIRVGVDVGGTFTDLVSFDASGGNLRVVKLPSTPPDFHLAVIDAVSRVDT